MNNANNPKKIRSILVNHFLEGVIPLTIAKSNRKDKETKVKNVILPQPIEPVKRYTKRR